MPLAMMLHPGPVMKVRELPATLRVLFDKESNPRRAFMLPNQAIMVYQAKDDEKAIPAGQVVLYNAHYDEPIDLMAGPDAETERVIEVTTGTGKSAKKSTKKEKISTPWRGKLQAAMPWWGSLEDAAIQTEQHHQDTRRTPMEIWDRWIMIGLGGMVLVDILVLIMAGMESGG